MKKTALAAGGELRELVAGFPKPAFLLSSDGRILAASPGADRLVEQTDPSTDGQNADLWWQDLTKWLFDQDGKDGGSLSALIPGAGDDGGDMLLDWQSTACSDGSIILIAQDNSLHHALNQALADSRQRFRDLCEMTGDFAWECDAAGYFAYVSTDGTLGYSSKELIGRPANRILGEQLNEGVSPFETKVNLSGKDVWMVRSDGDLVTQTVWARPILDAAGEWHGARGVCRDVSRSRRLEQQLARAQMRERLLDHILKSMRDELHPERSLTTAAQATVHTIAADGGIVFRVSEGVIGDPIACFAVVPPGEETNIELANRMSDLISLDEAAVGPPSLVQIDGAEAMVAVSRFRGRPVGLLAVWRRTTGDRWISIWDDDDAHVIQSVADQLGLAHEQMAHYEELERLAQRDALTGLYNRRALLDHVGKRFDAWKADQMQAIAYVDIDNFKGVNDGYGHQEGDQIIREVARIITDLGGPKDIAARIGGDEFVIWLDDTDDAAIDAFAQAVQAGGRTIAGRYTDVDPPGISVGIAIRDPEASESLTAMIARADKAMYQAKRGKSKVRGGRARISSRATQ
ncbi:MAG: diguanylate cyclase [Pseudomonadota bacterium]